MTTCGMKRSNGRQFVLCSPTSPTPPPPPPPPPSMPDAQPVPSASGCSPVVATSLVSTSAPALVVAARQRCNTSTSDPAQFLVSDPQERLPDEDATFGGALCSLALLNGSARARGHRLTSGRA